MEIQNNDIKIFQDTIRNNSAYNLDDYSANSLKRRLVKILSEFPSGFEMLIDRLNKDETFLEEILKKITVNTTELFRDPQVWNQLLFYLLPKYKEKEQINIWHPGCSTGQELYSMLIMLDQLNLLDKANIYGSDINTDVLETAKKGIYRLRFNKSYIENFNKIFNPESDEHNNSEYYGWDKYCKTDETRDQITIKKFLRNKPIFQKMDLVKEGNIFLINFDIIMCRNVIIYFNYELQNKVIKMFHRNLKEKGALILGLHESIIGSSSGLFLKNNNYYTKK